LLRLLSVFAFAWIGILAMPAAAQDAWYPIKGDDGSLIANHRLPVELSTQLDTISGTVTVGNPKGSIALYEFYDLNCPYCRLAAKDLPALVKAEPDLRLILVPYPVLGIPSIEAGRIELGVAKLESPAAFYEFHQEIYKSHGTIDARRALAEAKALGFDTHAILQVAINADTIDTLKAHAYLGNTLGLVATPSFVIQSVAILGYPGLRAIRDVVRSVAKCRLVVCGDR
jgi:protein-disulfide isomerase